MNEHSSIKRVLTSLEDIKEYCLRKQGDAVSTASAEFFRGYREGAQHAESIVIEMLLD